MRINCLVICLLLPLWMQAQEVWTKLTVEKCGFTTTFTLAGIKSDVEIIVKDTSTTPKSLNFAKNANKPISLPSLSDTFTMTCNGKSKKEDFRKANCKIMRPSKGGKEEEDKTYSYVIFVNDDSYDPNSQVLIVITSDNLVEDKKVIPKNGSIKFKYSIKHSKIQAIGYQVKNNEQVVLKVKVDNL